MRRPQAVDPVDLERARNQIVVRRLHDAEKPLRRLEDAALEVFVHGRLRAAEETLARLKAVGADEVRDGFCADARRGPFGGDRRQRASRHRRAGQGNPQPRDAPPLGHAR